MPVVSPEAIVPVPPAYASTYAAEWRNTNAAPQFADLLNGQAEVSAPSAPSPPAQTTATPGALSTLTPAAGTSSSTQAPAPPPAASTATAPVERQSRSAGTRGTPGITEQSKTVGIKPKSGRATATANARAAAGTAASRGSGASNAAMADTLDTPTTPTTPTADTTANDAEASGTATVAAAAQSDLVATATSPTRSSAADTQSGSQTDHSRRRDDVGSAPFARVFDQVSQTNITNPSVGVFSASAVPADTTAGDSNAPSDATAPISGDKSGRADERNISPSDPGQALAAAATTANGSANAAAGTVTAATSAPPPGVRAAGQAASTLADSSATPPTKPLAPGSVSDRSDPLPALADDAAAAASTAATSLPSDNPAPQSHAATAIPGSNSGSSDASAAGTAATAAAGPVTAQAPAGPPQTPSSGEAARVPLSDLVVTVAAQIASGKSRFEVRLDPPDLGRIDVQLNVDRGGNVGVRLVAERPDTLDLLRRDAPQLERALQDAGLDTGAGMQFSLADQGYANRNAFAPADTYVPAPTLGESATETAAVAAAPAYAAWSSRSSGLDITV